MKPCTLRPVDMVPSSPPRDTDLYLLLERVPRFCVDAGLPMALFLVAGPPPTRPVIVLCDCMDGVWLCIEPPAGPLVAYMAAKLTGFSRCDKFSRCSAIRYS